MEDNYTEEVTEIKLSQFAQDIKTGLESEPKRLSSKYFYDEKGDKLFQEIMKLDEYYLTRTEYEILAENKAEILETIANKNSFNLFELGAGDGYKTKLLLHHFVNEKVDFSYYPIDISGNVLKELKDNLREEIPSLNVMPLEGDYFKMLQNISDQQDVAKLVLFLGSNIGNFSFEESAKFVTILRDSLKTGDHLMIGVDLKKDPSVILKAYNDSKGITRAFNMNLLNRVNAELGADFDTEKFVHSPVYDPATGECRSYILSKEDQVVGISSIEKSFQLKKWEPIHMEISKKYDLEEIEILARIAGYEVVKHFTDKEEYFVDSLWRAI